MVIADALNTYNHSIDILIQKEYSVFLKDEDLDYILYLEKGNMTLKAEEPLSLLALVYLIENNLAINEDRIDFFVENNSSVAIKAITDKGFNISIERNSDWYDWLATNKKRSFYGSSPLKLLGLILIIEVFGENWGETDVPCYLNEL